jgi:hypothetical protein
VATNVKVHVATLCEQIQELAREAPMVLRRQCSIWMALSFSVEGLAGWVID